MSIAQAIEKLGAWFSKSAIPIAGTVALVLGAQVIWPRERLESLQAQQRRVDLRIDSAGFRIDSLKLQAAEEAIEHSRTTEEINRRLLTLSILACSNFKQGQGGNTLAFRLAGCPQVLSP